ncbi:conserved hypothetical protein [Coccidioides posadasii str. Silveira]|uniref:Uncharacterized protein n=2 Tax=Coccidioides posadasii TaxID=199306 RepID=E9DEU7_COCPS|nr:conserved hypothetical protein [Coccidioides posadasii str. Silveira]KMM68972.1 hypothetical protein CPAG_05295 [Coccidioides posadasii RMSCC 3488]
MWLRRHPSYSLQTSCDPLVFSSQPELLGGYNYISGTNFSRGNTVPPKTPELACGNYTGRWYVNSVPPNQVLWGGAFSRDSWAHHPSGAPTPRFPTGLGGTCGTLAASTFGASVLGKLSAPRRRTMTMTLAFWAFESRSAEAWLS